MDPQQLNSIFDNIGLGVISNSIFEYLKNANGRVSYNNLKEGVQKILNSYHKDIKAEAVIDILIQKGVISTENKSTGVKFAGNIENSKFSFGSIVGFDTGVDIDDKITIKGSEIKVGEIKHK